MNLIKLNLDFISISEMRHDINGISCTNCWENLVVFCISISVLAAAGSGAELLQYKVVSKFAAGSGGRGKKQRFLRH